MDRLSPQQSLSVEERIALDAAIKDLCGYRARRWTRPGKPAALLRGRRALIVLSVSVASILGTHAALITAGY